MSIKYSHLPEIKHIDRDKFYGFNQKTMSNLLGGYLDGGGSGIQAIPYSNEIKQKYSVYWKDPDSWTHPGILGHEIIAKELQKMLTNKL